jgi:hypothetical protein
MALLSFVGFDTPSLQAQGEQRRSSLFNIDRGNPSGGRCRIDDWLTTIVPLRRQL